MQEIAQQRKQRISIHALLAESDKPIFRKINTRGSISIHALLAESDFFRRAKQKTCLEFLSTLSLRRATDGVSYDVWADTISIHALLAESDS